MPDPTVAWLDGRLVPWSEARLPIEDRAVQFGESLYEVVAVTRSRPRRLGDHVGRMRRGADCLGLAGAVPPEPDWRALAAALVDAERVDEGLLYAQATGGASPRSYLPQGKVRPTFLAYLRAHRFPRERDVARGVRTVTVPDPRWARPEIKTTMLLPTVLAKREARARGAEDAILVGPDGGVREAASSNLYLVEGRTLCTPGPGAPHLPGTTRSLLARVADEARLRVVEGTIPVRRMLDADEVFLTATSLLAMPVVSIDGRPIGDGTAGPISLDLARRLRASLELD